VQSALVTVDFFQYSYNIGVAFFTIVRVGALEEEDVTTVSLSVPVAALGSEAVVSPTVRRVWSASPAIAQEKWVQCSEQ
jgi:hypothetical protein